MLPINQDTGFPPTQEWLVFFLGGGLSVTLANFQGFDILFGHVALCITSCKIGFEPIHIKLERIALR